MIRFCRGAACALALTFLLVPACLAAPGETGTAGATTPEPLSDEAAVAQIVEKLVDSIGVDGFVRFPEMAYPFLILVGGGSPPLVAIESGEEIGVFCEQGAGLFLSSVDVRLLGRVALAEFAFGPPGEAEKRATGFAVLCKPLDFWVVHVVALAPSFPPESDEAEAWARAEPKHRDALAALANAFGKSLTDTGFSKFEGISDVFVAFDGMSGTFRVFNEEDDYPVPGDPVIRTVTRIHAKPLPGLAHVQLTALGDEGAAQFELLCLAAPDGWQAAISLIGPATADEPADDDQPDEAAAGQ